MNYQPYRRVFRWPSRVALVSFAFLFLPMAPGVVETGLGAAQKDDDAAAGAASKTPYPQIVKTIPKQGATGVDPGLKEISVTFDRDMGKGMSWTGGPPLFPPIDKSREAKWSDARTCVLPVELAKGSYYRLGINSSGFQDFRGEDGVAAPPSTIDFATKGATEAVEGRVRKPEIVSIAPKNGATDVDPKTEVLKVKFSVPMGEGMSWTGDGPTYPRIPDARKPVWSADGLTCTLPVALEAGHDYELGLNNLSYNNFQSKWGVPLAPVVYKFHTRDAK